MKAPISTYKGPANRKIKEEVFLLCDIEKLFPKYSPKLDEIIGGPTTDKHPPIIKKQWPLKTEPPRMERRTALQIALNNVSTLYQMAISLKKYPSPSELRNHWRKIESDTRKIMIDMQWTPDAGWEGISDALKAEISMWLVHRGHRTAANVVQALRGVELLNKMAKDLEEKNIRKIKKQEDLVSPDVDLFMHLEFVFNQYSGLRFGKIDFIYACLDHFYSRGVRKKVADKESVETLLKRYKKLRLTWVKGELSKRKILSGSSLKPAGKIR